MRRSGLSATLFILLALLTAALVAPMPAAAGKKLRKKLDPSLVAMLAKTRNPNARFHVIVLGRSLDGARADADADIRHRLRSVHGQAMTVKAGKLLELAGSDGVLRVVPDRPMLPDTIGQPVSFPALTTLYPGIIGMQSVWNG